jgi:hypothetical protein
VIRLNIGHTRTVQLRPRARRSRVLLVAGLLLASLASASEPTSGELTTQRRAGRVRDLATCGTRKACLKRQQAEVAMHDSVRAAADSAAPTIRHSRWSADQYDDVRVWIAPGERVRRFRGDTRFVVRDAFHAWTAAGAPVRFVFVADSARADVHVVWRTRLPDGRAGQVTRVADRRGWLRSATIELSTRNLRGGVQKSSTVGAVALHEVGHLLGLEHSDDEGDVMAAWVTARTLSPRDRRAMRALYDVAESDEDVLAETLVLGGDLELAAREER